MYIVYIWARELKKISIASCAQKKYIAYNQILII